MKQLFLYTQCRWTTEKWSMLAWVLIVVVMLPLLYMIGLAGQPELFSYVEDGMFYGTYTYDFTRAMSMAGGAVVAWGWLCSIRSLSRYRARRTGIFYATLPVGWGVKFSYETLKSLVVVPVLLYGAFLLNQMVWGYLLVEPTPFFASSPALGWLSLLMWFNALFFMIGAAVGKHAWVWCVGVLLVVAGLVYLGETYQWEALKNNLQPAKFSDGMQTLLWSLTVVFVVIAARATQRMEVR